MDDTVLLSTSRNGIPVTATGVVNKANVKTCQSLKNALWLILMIFSCSFWTQSTSSPRSKIFEHYPGVLKTCQSLENGIYLIDAHGFLLLLLNPVGKLPQGKYPWTLSWSLENLSVTENGFWWMRMIFSCSFWTQLASFPRAKILEYYSGVLKSCQ